MSLLVLTQRHAQTYEDVKEKATEYKDAAALKMEEYKEAISKVHSFMARSTDNSL